MGSFNVSELSLTDSGGNLISSSISEFLLGPEQQADGHVFHAVHLVVAERLNVVVGTPLQIWHSAKNEMVLLFTAETVDRLLESPTTLIAGRAFTKLAD